MAYSIAARIDLSGCFLIVLFPLVIFKQVQRNYSYSVDNCQHLDLDDQLNVSCHGNIAIHKIPGGKEKKGDKMLITKHVLANLATNILYWPLMV
ncbi:MAG: hypothetical protein ACI8WB_003064 [Phenylobacterium sp.]|jgi:hypothetical protein